LEQLANQYLWPLIATLALSAHAVELSLAQKKRVMLITATFENQFPKGGSPYFRYDYIENLKDGRGYTAGRVGFCTGTGDLIEVVEELVKSKPKHALAKFVPELQRLAKEQSDDVSKLPGFEEQWRKAGKEPAMQKAQDEVAERLYYRPAMLIADKLKIELPLGRAILYDTIVMHGGGSDPDSLNAIAARVPREGKTEKEWLVKFLEERRKVLLNPANKATQAEWSSNAPRADTLMDMLKSGKYDRLDRKMVLSNYYFEGTIP